jgi:hypothetical protein
MSLLKQIVVKQQINLYLPRFRPEQLSAAMQLLVKSLAAALVFLLLVSIILMSSRMILQSQLEQSKQDQLMLTAELDGALAKMPNLMVDNILLEKIENQKELLKKQKRVISFLRQDSINDKASFTPLVEQLSQQSVEGVWLSRFEVINYGKDIQLFGYAKTPDKVSKYLSMLGENEAYQGRVFKQIQVKRGNKSWSEFFLSTQELKDDEALLLSERISGARL